MKYSLPEVAKAVGAFVVSLGLFAGALAENEAVKSVLPANWLVWLVALGGAATVAGVVFGIPNRLTERQVLDGAVALGLPVGGKVAEAAVASAAETAHKAVLDIAENLPNPARDVVKAGAKATSDLVEQVLREYEA